MAGAPGAGSDNKNGNENPEKKANGDVDKDQQKSGAASGSTSEASGTLSLTRVNSYKDDERVANEKLLESSNQALEMNLTDETMDSIFGKVLERKLEVLHWQMHQVLAVGSDQVLINLANKKDFVRVKLPVNHGRLQMPYSGNVSVTNSRGSYLFANVFGLNFFVQPRSDGLNSDILVPAWSAKQVAKSSDANFEQTNVVSKFMAYIEHGQQLTSISFVLVPDKDRLACVVQKEKDIKAAGGSVCYLPTFMALLLLPSCKHLETVFQLFLGSLVV